VTLDKETLALTLGGEAGQLTATMVPANASNQAVTWKSSDETVATVDANGKVTALKEGTTTITVTTADGGFTATCTVTVTPDYWLRLEYYKNASRFPAVIKNTENNTITLPAPGSASLDWIGVRNLKTNVIDHANSYWCYYSESDHMWIWIGEDYVDTVLPAGTKYGIMVRANRGVNVDDFAGIRPENVNDWYTGMYVEKVYLHQEGSDTSPFYPTIIIVPEEFQANDYTEELTANLAVQLNYDLIFGRLLEDDSIGRPYDFSQNDLHAFHNGVEIAEGMCKLVEKHCGVPAKLARCNAFYSINNSQHVRSHRKVPQKPQHPIALHGYRQGDRIEE
jgi:hypothetical protein